MQRITTKILYFPILILSLLTFTSYLTLVRKYVKEMNKILDDMTNCLHDHEPKVLKVSNTQSLSLGPFSTSTFTTFQDLVDTGSTGVEWSILDLFSFVSKSAELYAHELDVKVIRPNYQMDPNLHTFYPSMTGGYCQRFKVVDNSGHPRSRGIRTTCNTVGIRSEKRMG